jgi:hypothetical protein
VTHLANQARLLQADYDAQEQHFFAITERLRSLEFGDRLWLSELRVLLGSLPAAWNWRVVEQLFLDRLGFRLGEPASERLLEVIRGTRTACQLPSGVEIRRSEGGLAIFR